MLFFFFNQNGIFLGEKSLSTIHGCFGMFNTNFDLWRMHAYIVKAIQKWYMIGVWVGGITVPVLFTYVVKYKHA